MKRIRNLPGLGRLFSPTANNQPLTALLLLVLAASVLFIACPGGKSEIKIGAILTLSGEAAPYGQSAKNALEMGLKEARADGSLKDREVSLVFEDDRLDPKTGVSAFRKLVETDKVTSVIGPMMSSVALAIAPVANDKKVILLSPSASSPSLTEAGD